MKPRVPILPLFIVAVAVIVWLNPALSRFAIYDRSAVLRGEIWRLLTAPWVHFTPSHLAYDALALGLAGMLIAWRRYGSIGWLCGLTPLLTGLVLLWLQPELQFYGGLSGLATAAVVFLALHGLREAGLWRWVCLAALLGTAGHQNPALSLREIPA